MTIPCRSHWSFASNGAASRIAALICVAALALWGTASGQSRETLGEGDAVRITVFQNPDLTTETRVSERGTITFPMIGEVKVGGLTPAAAESQIAQQLERGKFVVKPQVNLNVTQLRSRQVTVLGQVQKPGRYALEDATAGVTDIVALAGGITPTGDENVIVVSRDGKTRRMVPIKELVKTGDTSQNVRVENGDTIYVQTAPVFYIYGEVQRAGAYKLEPSMSVMQAIAVGGGVTPRGTQRGLQIRRREPDGSIRTIDASLTDRLAADDVVYVRESLF
jgi:polysaccharide export outer membrane protein